MRVELLEVIDPQESEAELRRFSPSSLRSSKRSCAAYLKSVAETFPSSSSVEPRVEVGNPAEIIAARGAGTLIAMSSHGRSGLQHWLLGSVASKVAQIATDPLLLVRATAGVESGGEARLETLVAPLDGSPLAETALAHARELATGLGLHVVLLRVRQGAAETTSDEVMIEEPKIAADDYLKRTASWLKAEGVAQVSCVVLQGSPPAEIVEAARNAPHAMIVMATHGRTGVRRWLLGSVTEGVIQRAVAPVLVVRV